jgi:hypothetical protein
MNTSNPASPNPRARDVIITISGSLVVIGGGFLTVGGVLFYLVARSPAALYDTWNGFFLGGMIAGFLCFSAGVLILTRFRWRILWGWVALMGALVGVFLGFGGLVFGTSITVLGGLLAIASGGRRVPESSGAHPEPTPILSRKLPLGQASRPTIQAGAAVILSVSVLAAGLSYVEADLQASSFLFAHPETFDLQVIDNFGNWSRGLAYAVSATPQPSDCGFGFAYLINGFTSANYWYQVGLGFNWHGGTNSFQFIYEVFGPAGLPVFPTAGGGAGILSFSRSVQAGDFVILNLTFVGGSVLMSGYDKESSGVASASYSNEGATSFQAGGTSTPGGGTFTGLMTECYRGVPFGFDLRNATYHDEGQTQTMGVVTIDEWNYSWGRYPLFGTAVFPPQSSGALNFTNSSLQAWTYPPIVTWSSATDFSAATY